MRHEIHRRTISTSRWRELGFQITINSSNHDRALGIVIDASGDEVFLSGSDLETSSKAHFAADIKEKGKVLVPGRLLAEITRSLPNKPISISLDGSRVLVTSGSAKFTHPTL